MIRSRLVLSFGERLDLSLAVGEEAPEATDVLVVPQDVQLIMGDVVAVEDTGTTLEEVAEGAARDSHPLESGTIVVLEDEPGPLVIQAIVYDFERSPPVRREDVFAALLAAFEETHRRSLKRVAVRPLGTAHSGIDAEAFLESLTQVCYSSAELGTSIRHVDLLLPSTVQLARYEVLLQGLAGPGEPLPTELRG